MAGSRAVYVDSSAIIKLVVQEPESSALRAYLGRRKTLISNSIARTEVMRSVLAEGAASVARAAQVLSRIELLRMSDRVLAVAGGLLPLELRTLDAIHLASALELGEELGRVVTYDVRMAVAARELGFRVESPA
ncbi:MAG TPA: type II toxin-antitoxin system VapC family toxin [Chloroflexota bacterium]|jgi:predicted nucleic acid-binding protein|nr:type II toxin-antitoxin system VapC family toxin [Chloroflexota bacterium]